MSFQIAMIKPGKGCYYLKIDEQFYLSCSVICNVHYYIWDSEWNIEWQIQNHCHSYR